MAQIPMVGELAEVLGHAAEKVENRSLLLDKFAFHKKWPQTADDRGREIKWDEASRWSFIRIADGAGHILNKEAAEKRRKAEGPNIEEKNKPRLRDEAKIAETLANVAWDQKDLMAMRQRHTRRFIGLFRSAYGKRAFITVGQLEGRLAINLSGSLIQNAGISLDRLFGMPFIPGSAVKGSARHAALEELKTASGEKQAELFQHFRMVFGTADNDFEAGDLARFARYLQPGQSPNYKGGVSFLPAYPLNEARIVVDLTNVHYPEYYQSGRMEDLSKENPRPNPFPVVETGAQFAFCFVANHPELSPEALHSARQWLEAALTIRGLGAKTAAGYGWFLLQPALLEKLEAEEKAEAEAAAKKAAEEAAKRQKEEELARKRAALPPHEAARDDYKVLNQEAFAKIASDLNTLSPDQQKGFLLALLTPEKKDSWKTWKKSDKPANKTRVELILAAAKNLGINLP
ncbi:MAG: type III-B CRISPR module RAMP protein Cmr6 [Verrucomicrobiales bacterium]